MNNSELADEIVMALTRLGHTAYRKNTPENTEVAVIGVIDDDERRCHSIIVDYAIAPRVAIPDNSIIITPLPTRRD